MHNCGNRKLVVAMVVSLLAHALIYWFLNYFELLDTKQPPASPKQTMVVQLGLSEPDRHAAEPVPELPKPQSSAPVRKAQKVVKPAITPRTEVRNEILPQVIAAPKEVPVALPSVLPAKAAEVPPKVAIPDPAQFPDMMSYLAAVREKRQDPGRINEIAKARESERAAQEATSTKAQSGTNGIFQVLSMDARAGRFAFRGWKNEFSYSHREVYEVFASPDGTVERAMVRKMIEIIRRDYDGDFNWDSPRFGRVMVLSARLDDSDELEGFLLNEFFGSSRF